MNLTLTDRELHMIRDAVSARNGFHARAMKTSGPLSRYHKYELVCGEELMEKIRTELDERGMWDD